MSQGIGLVYHTLVLALRYKPAFIATWSSARL